MDRLPRLEIIANYGVGYDTVDAAEAGRRGIVVSNTPDVLTEEVADLAIGLMLAAIHPLPLSNRKSTFAAPRLKQHPQWAV
jgi:lactate dehydrogenase-like 2-hydroxyacid dehydrogenase